MTLLAEVASAIRALLPTNGCPVVVHATAWPFLRTMRCNDLAAIERLLDCVLDSLGTRTVLMPTFTQGYGGGVCDLDSEPSTSGMLTECFRRRPGTCRTLSGFFSYAVRGDAGTLLDRRPEHAWGAGSVYEWMEEHDVSFLMLGTHPTQCSYLHRLEWLLRERIPYRHEKTFTGRLIRNGTTYEMTENLFVRTRQPPVVSDFTPVLPRLQEAGMAVRDAGGASIATYRPSAIRATVLPALRNDPLLFVKNRLDHEATP